MSTKRVLNSFMQKIFNQKMGAKKIKMSLIIIFWPRHAMYKIS
jgi:hypothetical protein